jgi:hypothetical protein
MDCPSLRSACCSPAIQETLADRVALEAIEAEFSAEILSGRQSEDHRDTDLGSHACLFTYCPCQEQSKTAMGLFKYGVPNPPAIDELYQHLQLFGRPSVPGEPSSSA